MGEKRERESERERKRKTVTCPPKVTPNQQEFPRNPSLLPYLHTYTYIPSRYSSGAQYIISHPPPPHHFPPIGDAPKIYQHGPRFHGIDKGFSYIHMHMHTYTPTHLPTYITPAPRLNLIYLTFCY